MEVGCDDEVGRDDDRLSSLLENIIRHIFSFLGSIDVVRASSVSKQWRYFWVSMPYLNFESNGYDFGSRSEIKFNYFVNWVLMSRNRNCVLKQHTFPGFSKLKSLELCFVLFIDSLSLANFVSSCPVLENLSVEGCMFVDDNIIDITSTGLKDLSFILPKLSTFFKYPMRREQAREYGLKVAYHHYGPYGHLKVEGCHALSKMLQGVYNLKALKISEAFPESNSSIMSKAALKMLNIPDDPCKMLNMPNGTTPCLKYNLQIVELFLVRDDKYELDLVMFFLKNGHVLQKMGISWVYGHENTDEIISEVLKLPRSSPNVALTFIEPLSISFYGELTLRGTLGACCVIETDALVVELVNTGCSTSADVDLVIQDIIDCSSNVVVGSISFMPRKANVDARTISRMVLSIEEDLFWMESYPPCVERCNPDDNPV
ncbi:hypothetical protein Dsin_022984 [Dipteronia sinensis]|uniref:F-box domain-containing protein n=1 Tax=Dipteronia sinensis TaxID=43782 RepID=A0AAE0E0L2_9ROSI|nr:hypothetical protein Dsin_022984 [Dipteronia sinensis]